MGDVLDTVFFAYAKVYNECEFLQRSKIVTRPVSDSKRFLQLGRSFYCFSLIRASVSRIVHGGTNPSASMESGIGSKKSTANTLGC